MIDEVYKSFCPDSNFDSDSKELFLNFYKDFLSNSRKFISCFSEEPDILSQWRAYADDGAGFSVGFSVDQLEAVKAIPEMNHARSIDTVYLIKVLYSQNKQHELITKCIQRANGASVVGSFDGIDTLSNLAIALKNPCFAEEKEWRLIFPLGLYDVSPYLTNGAVTECLFRQKRQME